MMPIRCMPKWRARCCCGMDYVTLYANGIRYLEKAPLLYWSMAASFRMFGVSDAAARVPLALYALALTFAVSGAGDAGLFRRCDGRFLWCADPADLVRDFHFYAHHHSRHHRLSMDNAGDRLLLAFLCRKRSRVGGVRLGFAAACALNVLTKGLIGVVFPVAIVLIFLLVHEETWGTLRTLGNPFAGFALFPADCCAVASCCWTRESCARKPARLFSSGCADAGKCPRIFSGSTSSTSICFAT